MHLKKLKEWINSLPDDTEILILENEFMSMPCRSPVLMAIDGKSIKQESPPGTPGFVSGKVISSFSNVGIREVV